MKNYMDKLIASVMIATMVAFSGNVTAQTRRSTAASQQTTRSTATATQNRTTTATQNRPTSASQSRSTTGTASATQQVRRTTGTASTSASQSRSTGTATQNRSTSASQSRSTTGTASTTQQVRRTTGSSATQSRSTGTATQNRTTTGTGQSRTTTATQNRATSASQRGTSGTTSTTTANPQIRRTAGGNAGTTATVDNGATQRSSNTVRNVTINNNVSRRGLSTVGNDNRGDRVVENDYSKDPNNRFAGRDNYNDRYYDDHRMEGHNVLRVHPRERAFMPYDRIGSFWGHDPHYFGYRVQTLPRRYVKVRYYGVDYYRYGNVYYRPYRGYYVVCRPPFGVVIETPVVNLRFRNVTFSFYSNVYRSYRGFDSYSVYIDSQNRQIARNNAILAEQNRQIAMNLNAATSSYELANRLGLAQSYAYANQEYFYSDGIFYIIKGNNYQTIVPPAGALVEELPDDYQTITLGNAEYYRVDDTVYKTTMVSGRPYLEVLGQMYGSLATRYSLF